MTKVHLDLNSPEFQKDFLKLESQQLVALQKTLNTIRQQTWEQAYQNKGLKWEKIQGKEIYTFRFSQKYRATAVREGDFLRILALHTDHDSAYH